MAAYDAFVLVSFGGPEGPADVMPFLRNGTGGRNGPARLLGQPELGALPARHRGRHGRRRCHPRPGLRDVGLQLVLELPAVPGRHRARPRPPPAQRAEPAAVLAGPGGARGPWRLAYTSRSGPPSQPWLVPDVNDLL